MKKLITTLLAALSLAAGADRAHAVYTLTVAQVGTDVVISGSGSFNLTALTFVQSNGASVAYGGATYGYLTVGVPPTESDSEYGNITGPTSFGTGSGLITPNSGTGTLGGVWGGASRIIVPNGYTSGTFISGMDTYNNTTIANLGFTSSPVTYTWGTGANADSLTITSAVPEPSTWGMLGLGAVGAGVLVMRRRQVAA